MSKTTNKFSPEVRERAVRLVLDNEGQHVSRWRAVMSISAKIGCAPQTLNAWVRKAGVDSGKRAGIPTDMAEKMRALGSVPGGGVGGRARSPWRSAARGRVRRWRSPPASEKVRVARPGTNNGDDDDR